MQTTRMPSRKDVDRIGDRLRDDPLDLDAISQLWDYCNLVKSETDGILAIIQQTTSLNVIPREGKTFRSIKEKLRRLLTKLSQIQDIEGCRIIVESPIEQDALIFRLDTAFPRNNRYDRRGSLGYQAVHFVIRHGIYRYEVQVRTTLQHAWAQVSEAVAGKLGQTLKYIDYSEVDAMLDDPNADPRYDRDEDAVSTLLNASRSISIFEKRERFLFEVFNGYRSDDIADEWRKLDVRFDLTAKLGQGPDLSDENTLADLLKQWRKEVLDSKSLIKDELQSLLDRI